ncbi:MFS transporter [Rhodococcus sp. 06-462-5]|nr:MFS transporter [Rhodococcus sp. 06-462-5]OZE67978.1 MFS transporter [Rhodococcus sp. 02-925g]OZF52001.1 MFS transporter [Rhodococcus sp. 14-1411-2a]
MLQGFGAAGGVVLAMAVVRDLFDGNAAAVMMSRLMLVMGVAPILAPTIGGFVLTVSTWRSIFLVLAVLGAVVVLLGLFAMPETLPVGARTWPRPTVIATNYGRLCTNPHFVRMVLVSGAGRVLMFSYIAASPFVLQGQFGLSPQQFGLSFAGGAAVLIASSQLKVVLLSRWGPRTLLRATLSTGAVVGAVFVVLAATGTGGLWGFAVPVMALLAVMGSVMPNAPAVALTDQREVAGTASALIGGFQFTCAAAAAPVVGLLGNDALAVASMMGGAAAVAALLVFADRRRRLPNRNE